MKWVKLKIRCLQIVKCYHLLGYKSGTYSDTGLCSIVYN